MKYKLEDILQATLEVLEITPDVWRTMKQYRVANIVKVKQYVSLIAFEEGYGHTGIAEFLHINRTTVIHHINTMRDLVSVYKDFKKILSNIRMRLDGIQKEQRECIRQGWLARSKRGLLIFSPEKPELIGDWWLSEGGKPFQPQDSFPQVTFESGPIKVNIKITIENEKV